MRNLTKFITIASVVTFTACEVDTVTSIEPKESLDGNAYALPYVVNVENGLININDIANSEVSFVVDVKKSSDVESVTLLKNFNGGSRVVHATISSFPATLSINALDLIDGLGVTADALVAGDGVNINFVTNYKNGKSSETNGNLRLQAACLLPDGLFVGTYDLVDPCYEQVFGVPGGPSEVTLSIDPAYPATVRKLDGLFFGPGVYYYIDLSCGEIIVPDSPQQVMGVGCGATIVSVSTGDPASEFSSADDSSLEISVAYGDCLDGVACIIQLTKQ